MCNEVKIILNKKQTTKSVFHNCLAANVTFSCVFTGVCVVEQQILTFLVENVCNDLHCLGCVRCEECPYLCHVTCMSALGFCVVQTHGGLLRGSVASQGEPGVCWSSLVAFTRKLIVVLVVHLSCSIYTDIRSCSHQ